jgi:mannose-6-phosphate isomerase-like protein (cupin superfamily)
LHEGDVLVFARQAAVPITGRALVLAVRRTIACEGEAEKSLARAGAAEELTWAGGQMHAHLDVGRTVSPEIYFGRLSGTASVAEHAHPGAWEVLAAVEASGTFTIAGEPHRLGPRQIVAIPPDTNHAWQADPGTRLVALQMYDPPGAEQRFIGLAKGTGK